MTAPKFKDKTMSCYWVYENWPTSRARFHRADCSYCDDGRGIHMSAGTRNGRWHGPFGTRAKAESFAGATGRRDVGPCRNCL